VRQFIRDNALFWLHKYRLDGLRFDSVIHIRNRAGHDNDPANDLPDGWSLMQWINDEIRARQPWKITIAEDLQGNEWLTRETAAGGAGFGSQWDAGFVHTIRRAIIAGSDDDRDVGAVAAAIAHRDGSDACRRVIYTESHDEVANGRARVPEEIWPGNAASWFSRKRSTLGATLVFTSPGIPMIFQGQEFLEDEYFRDEVPLDWSKLARYGGIHTLYRDLIRLRRNWFNRTRGLAGQHVHVHHVSQAGCLIAFHRWADGGPGDDVVVVANFANRAYERYTIGFPRPGQWEARLNTDSKFYGSDFGNAGSWGVVAGGSDKDGMPARAEIAIAPYSAIIFSQ
jgi:1,4-alpha-glucan branching enzyme